MPGEFIGCAIRQQEASQEAPPRAHTCRWRCSTSPFSFMLLWAVVNAFESFVFYTSGTYLFGLVSG